MKEWMTSIQTYSTIVNDNDKIRKIDDCLIERAKAENESELELPEEDIKPRVREDFEPINNFEVLSDFDLVCNNEPKNKYKENIDFESDSFKVCSSIFFKS